MKRANIYDKYHNNDKQNLMHKSNSQEVSKFVHIAFEKYKSLRMPHNS